ncbi:MAG TPA: TIGR03620 family F420-dependent LLM class oxidoreductase [Acidimicrobiales bacterium]|nr:TIGR03620 family F420-dependent LLM class oxidoreductase [Acidimicrobiales bacterium]
MTTALDDWRRRLGRVGVWIPPLGGNAEERRQIAARVEEQGFGSLWIGGGNAEPDAFDRLASYLEGTAHLVVATGIANIWSRAPADMRAAAEGLAHRFPRRFVLGLGVSHAPLVESLGRVYERPLATMRRYLEELDPTGPPEDPPRVIAALGPAMLGLARDRTAGAHPYLVPPQHTAIARQELGADRLLVPEQAVLLTTGAPAREGARAYLSLYLRLPNYVSNLRRLGFESGDLERGGSDRLVDEIVAHGAADAVSSRVRAHLDAGADHVLVQPLDNTGRASLDGLDAVARVLANL